MLVLMIMTMMMTMIMTMMMTMMITMMVTWLTPIMPGLGELSGEEVREETWGGREVRRDVTNSSPHPPSFLQKETKKSPGTLLSLLRGPRPFFGRSLHFFTRHQPGGSGSPAWSGCCWCRSIRCWWRWWWRCSGRTCRGWGRPWRGGLTSGVASGGPAARGCDSSRTEKKGQGLGCWCDKRNCEATIRLAVQYRMGYVGLVLCQRKSFFKAFKCKT